MSEKRTFDAIGVDGCKGGWFFARIDRSGKPSFGVVANFLDILEAASLTDRIFVDIPIGLASTDDPAERKCDVKARQVCRAGTVFGPPAAEVVDCYKNPTRGQWRTEYRKANVRNRGSVNRGLSAQAFGIVSKIKEVREVLADWPHSGPVVREIHPEVCFWGLAGRKMRDSKGTHNGYWERIGVMEKVYPVVVEAVRDVQVCEEFTGTVAPDDVLDAMVAALAATSTTPKTLPVCPHQDSRGFDVEMVYANSEGIDV